MKRIKLIIILLSVIIGGVNAQVGINTEDPKSLLDIRAFNKVNPEQNVGLIVPRISAFPTMLPTIDQHSQLVFLNHSGAENYWKNSFYYWDNTVPTWIQIIDENVLDLDFNKIICNGDRFYNNSGAESNLTNSGRPRYVRFKAIDSADESFKLTSDGELELGRTGRYSIALTGGVYKGNSGIVDVKCEVLINGNSALVPISSIINLASTRFRSGVFATTQYLTLNAGDKLSIKVDYETTATSSETIVNSPFTLILTLIEEL